MEIDEFLAEAKNHAELVVLTTFDKDQPRENDRAVARKAVIAGLNAIGLEEVGAAIEAPTGETNRALQSTEVKS